MNYQTQKVLLTNNVKAEAEDYLTWECYQSNNLYNSVLFEVRQAHFATCETRVFFDKNDCYRQVYKDRFVQSSYGKLCQQFKGNKHYQALGGQQGQQCIKSVVEAVNSYNELLTKWWNKEIDYKPKIPGYRTSGGMYQVAFTNQNITYNECEGYCRLSIARINKPELVEPEILIPSGTGFSSEQLKEVRIVPACGKLWAEYVYVTPKVKANNLDYKQAIGIDPGVTNLLSVVSTEGKSFIVCGRQIKSFNQRYNRAVAKHKSGKPQAYWDNYLDKLTHKRNCRVRDVVNKSARFIINYCLQHGIGNIVFGWGQGVKNNVNLGKKNNQNFVAIPMARLKNRIKELAESVGIKFHETEEAYTSKSDYLAGDLLFKYGEKPDDYKFSGRRITRGTYKSRFGLINADSLGSINALKKVATQLGISLAEVGRAALALPKRYDLSSMRRSYRKRVESRLQPLS